MSPPLICGRIILVNIFKYDAPSTLALLCFIDNWNVVEQPLIYFDNEGMYPLSVTLTDVGCSDYGIIFACGVIFLIPALLIYLYGHRDIDSPFVGTDKG